MVREGWSWEGCSHDLVSGGWVSSIAYLWGGREEGGEFLILCDFVPVFSKEGLEMGEVWGIGCNYIGEGDAG